MLWRGPTAVSRLTLASWRLVVAVVRSVGREEVTIGAGIGMVTVALWPAIGQLALLPAGLILIWLSLPMRTRFIAPPDARRDRRHE